MKVLTYTGRSHVREISSSDIESAWGIVTSPVLVDVRVSKDVTVTNRLAAKLLSVHPEEWTLKGDAADTEEELTEAAAAEEAARAAQEEMDAERHLQEAEQAKAAAESGEGAASPASGEVDSPPEDKAAPSPRTRPRLQP